VDVFLNGVKLVDGDDYTATNGSTVTLTVAAVAGDNVELVAYRPRGLIIDSYAKSESDARYMSISSTTTNIPEGTNLYFTNARARSAISIAGSGSYDSSTGVITISGGVTSVNTLTGAVTLTTTNISEGTNLYFTNARARSAISVSGSGSYDSNTGVITVTGGVTSVNTLTGAVTLTTTNISEGTNLYFTNARARSAISVSGSGSYDSNTGVITVTGGVTSVNTLTGAVTLTTTNISEGTNLYYTNARVDTRINATSINALSDVDTATIAPSDGQVLAWNAASSLWKPATASGGGGTTGGNGTILLNLTSITSNYTLATGYNGFSVGPISIPTGVTVIIPPTQRWVIA
jgi:ribosomal protein L18E